MNTFTMTAGEYWITDACQTKQEYYDWLMDGDHKVIVSNGKNRWVEPLTYDPWGGPDGLGNKLGSTFIRDLGGDGGGYIRDMKNNIVGEWGSDAGNVSVVPAKMVDRDVPSHYGMKVKFDEDFDIKCYHDAIVIGNKYRVRCYHRYWYPR